MKTKILILVSCFILTTSMTFAATLTVSNHPLGGSQYNDLYAAHNAAANGDTLIVEGTDIIYYLNFNWNKSLTVIGSGFNTNKQRFKKTNFVTYYGSEIKLASGSAGSSFYGILFTNRVEIIENNANNLTFEDCEFKYSLITNNHICNNLVIRNCIFNADNTHNLVLPGTASSTVLVSNCVFDGFIGGHNNTTGAYIFENCLFLSTVRIFNGVQYASISNCIFMNYFPGGTTNCIYLNNICRVAGTFPPSGNTGSGNIENTDPALVTYTFNGLYSTTHDYHLQTGSPCTAAGVGGTDIGVHGGTAKFSEYGEPLIAPVVRSMQINNTTVTPNETMNVDISASKPIDN